jgi:hypothetical protein
VTGEVPVHVFVIIAPRVRGPATPLGVIPLSAWNALTAERVAVPKYPVGSFLRYPLSFKKNCSDDTCPLVLESFEPKTIVTEREVQVEDVVGEVSVNNADVEEIRLSERSDTAKKDAMMDFFMGIKDTTCGYAESIALGRGRWMRGLSPFIKSHSLKSLF